MEQPRNTRTRRAGYDIRPAQKPKPKSASPEPQIKKKPKAFELNFSVPSLKPLRSVAEKAKKNVGKIPRKFIVAGGLALVVGIYFLFLRPMPASTNSDTTNNPRDVSKAAPTLQQGTPDYDTILPSNKTIAQLGGWTRVSPPDRNPVFAYLDKIGDVPINVSQQPLPKGFEIEADGQLEQLAAGFKANEKITAGSTPVYIGTSAKGPQSVIFSKSKLLILIKSSVKVSDSQWSTYVNSLQ